MVFFQNAASNKADDIEVDVPVKSAGGGSEPEYNFAAINHNFLSIISDFDAEFWSRDTFIKNFYDCNRKTSLSAMVLQRMYQNFFNSHHEKWISIKKPCSVATAYQRTIQH